MELAQQMIWLQIRGGESFSVPTIHQGSEYRVVSDSTQLRTCRHPHTQTGGSAATVTKHSYLVKFHTILHSIIDSHKTFLLGQISHYTAQYYRQSQNIPTWSNFTLYCTVLSTVTKHSYLVKFHTILHSIIDSHKTFLLGQISHYTAQYYQQKIAHNVD